MLHWAPGKCGCVVTPTLPPPPKARVMLNIYSSRTFSGIPTEPLLFFSYPFAKPSQGVGRSQREDCGWLLEGLLSPGLPAVVVGYLAPLDEAIYSLHI